MCELLNITEYRDITFYSFDMRKISFAFALILQKNLF